ncbi:hypothetical protein [Sphingomonas sp.]|uniref:hypothetical protein n=1 Tax=Sphingomonas sp. TaxID=28214 RepID=UPI000DB8C966|nr:hypothetical protein [Sphingomonas sp.]PZU06407.1 MAG: hypothetical protein DI605_19115 [Sphingomonas sp.]
MNFRKLLRLGMQIALSALLPAIAHAENFQIRLGPQLEQPAYDGRLVLIFSKEEKPDLRSRDTVNAFYDSDQIYGVSVDGLSKSGKIVVDKQAIGFPQNSLSDLPAGRYFVQASLNVYTTYHRADGHVVKLPSAHGGGQIFAKEPGNLYSIPRWIDFDPKKPGTIGIVLDHANPPIPDPADTPFVKHIRIRSTLLSKFWGTDIYLRAHVLVPKDFDQHPEAHFPLIVFHGHFPADFGGFRTTPPDPNAKCVPSWRFRTDCYNHTEDQESYNFYKYWTDKDTPRALIVEIDHSNQYYDDSYAVNSANLGPYGDAIMRELIPAIEQKYHGIGRGWARFLYGGSTGGWESLAVQVKYPDEFNGAFVACPDPVDFRAMLNFNLYEEPNAYYRIGPFGTIVRPAYRDYLGQISRTIEGENRWELVLGDKDRSGGQYDIWNAVFSPVGPDGYPARIWDKRTGVIDKSIAGYWRDNYDLRHIMERDWATLGPKLRGKIHIYVGEEDSFYLNDAVYLIEDFLKKANPPFEGEVDYGARAEHCWNGDHINGNGIARLRYNSFYMPKIMTRIRMSAPAGADVTSWRYP